MTFNSERERECVREREREKERERERERRERREGCPGTPRHVQTFLGTLLYTFL